ncbi:MAG: cytochrome c, partial [Flavobacteriales bacterium]|nr:cytochrome c [Flavobacteriales bacterium]
MTPVSDCFDAIKLRLRLIASLVLISLTVPVQAAIFDGGDAAKGKDLFNANCSACHKVKGVLNAPELYGIETRWKSTDAMLVKWINNPTAALASGDPYITAIVEKYKGQFGMMTAQNVSEAEIKDIFAYVKTGGGTAGAPAD